MSTSLLPVWLSWQECRAIYVADNDRSPLQVSDYFSIACALALIDPANRLYTAVTCDGLWVYLNPLTLEGTRVALILLFGQFVKCDI
jgi:hypothetical protein